MPPERGFFYYAAAFYHSRLKMPVRKNLRRKFLRRFSFAVIQLSAQAAFKIVVVKFFNQLKLP
jgi:hypothetical protein